MTDPETAAPVPGAEEPDAADPDAQGPLRVSSLELFFDLVFAFTLTQLTALLAGGLSGGAAGRVLLLFGLLWWMYEGYAWLTNARPPVHATERILLLTGMAGFLIVGLAIPRGFGRDGVELGLGYLVVVVVHACLFYRANTEILRIAPFNISSAVLVTVAGLAGGPARYPLWIAAVAIQLGSPLVVHPRHRFRLQPEHLAERHSALLIVALGESVAAISIGSAAAGAQPGAGRGWLLVSSVLGLALAGVLWWIAFASDDERLTREVLRAASREQRIDLALTALFYGNVPVLLGLVAMAAGVAEAVATAGHPAAGQPGGGALLGAGAALFLAGDVLVRRLLGIGSVRIRTAGAGAALATTAVGAAAGLLAQLAVLTVVLVVMLLAEQRWDAESITRGAAG